ncbi:K1586 ligase, partial [Atractosteus spatula]|nr:K1586 ligase [Atractosteus spatula]
MHLSEEWIHGDVSRPLQNQKRKKIYKHHDSLSHKRAVDIEETKQKEILPNKVLPELNGAKVGTVHKSDRSCAEIIGHIAKQMQNKLVSSIKELKSQNSLTIDESTVNGHAHLIIYMRCDESGKGDVDNVYLDTTELTDGTDTESIYSCLRGSLSNVGFDDEFMKKYLISIATDGAAVLTGKSSGLTASLKHDFPKVQSIHCLAHCRELAVQDALKEVAGCNHFEFFIAKLYSLYYQSTKNARMLEKAAADLNVQILKIGQIEDASRSATERQKHKGLHKRLTNSSSVADLASMKDALRELLGLSLKLRNRDTSLVESSCHIQQTFDILTARKDTGGQSAVKAKQRSSLDMFKDVDISEGTGKINRLQFYQSVINSLTKRLGI